MMEWVNFVGLFRRQTHNKSLSDWKGDICANVYTYFRSGMPYTPIDTHLAEGCLVPHRTTKDHMQGQSGKTFLSP